MIHFFEKNVDLVFLRPNINNSCVSTSFFFKKGFNIAPVANQTLGCSSAPQHELLAITFQNPFVGGGSSEKLRAIYPRIVRKTQHQHAEHLCATHFPDIFDMYVVSIGHGDVKQFYHP